MQTRSDSEAVELEELTFENSSPDEESADEAVSVQEPASLTSESRLKKLAKDFALTTATRTTSLVLYSVPQTQYSGQNENTLLLMAYFSILGLFSQISRESQRYLVSATKNAVSESSEDNYEPLQDMLRISWAITLPTTFFVWFVSQIYTLLLEYLNHFLGRPAWPAQALRFIPSQFVINSLLVQLLNALSNYANGRGQLWATFASFTMGGLAIVGSYSLIRLLTHGLNGFIFANIIQNVTIISTYMLYWQIFHHKERLVPSLFNARKWIPALRNALHILYQGLQPAAIFTVGALSNVFTVFLMRDKIALAAFQSVQSILNIFSAIIISLESRILIHVIDAAKRFHDQPQKLKNEIKKIMLYSILLGSILPLAFLFLAATFPSKIAATLIRQNDDNTDVINTASGIMLLVALVPIWRMLCATSNAVVTAFKQDEKDIFHQKQNRKSTISNSAMSVIGLLIGIGLDYVTNLGAYGYLLGINISLAISWLSLTCLAMQSIQHEVNKANAYSNIPPVANSWLGFLSRASIPFMPLLNLKDSENNSINEFERPTV